MTVTIRVGQPISNFYSASRTTAGSWTNFPSLPTELSSCFLSLQAVSGGGTAPGNSSIRLRDGFNNIIWSTVDQGKGFISNIDPPYTVAGPIQYLDSSGGHQLVLIGEFK